MAFFLDELKWGVNIMKNVLECEHFLNRSYNLTRLYLTVYILV